MKDVARAKRAFWSQVAHVAGTYVLLLLVVWAFVCVGRVFPGYLARAKDEAAIVARDYERNCAQEIRTSVDCSDLVRRRDTPVHWRAASETVEHLNIMDACGTLCVHIIHTLSSYSIALVLVAGVLVLYGVYRSIQLRDARQTLEMMMMHSQLRERIDGISIMGEVLRDTPPPPFKKTV